MSADSPRRSSGSRGFAVPAVVPPQVVSDRSILDSAIGFINDVTLANQPHTDPKDTITWARFETAADISDPRYGEDWELEGNVAPPLLLILGFGLGVQVWAIPANGEAVEVLSWRHGIVTALRVLPTPVTSHRGIEEHGRADESIDAYAEKRPLIALVDGSASASSQPQFCAVNFVSLKTGTQVKTIKFKNPVLDILANRSSIVITFHERIAVFDARTLEDRLSITTCFPSPGINPNPVALGPRWLAYAEQKLIHSKRSGGGCDGDGVASYTATVLNAAKSFGKGLRELGEQVAAGLTGTAGSSGNSKNSSFDSISGVDGKQPGVITIMDIKHSIKDYSPTSGTPMTCNAGSDPIVAHFIAHPEAVVAMEFDNSGMLLLTADRRGHDFHVFRIQPHPVGSSLAAVHHLYVLHRGDTSAKVQNIAFSLDARWVAISTLRGTTHVFPITPYGGPMGVRTHTSLHVVNKLSRFHRSAGLSADGRSNSPISHSESTTFVQSLQPYHNPTLPPFSRPTVVLPLTQLRQPFALGTPPGSANLISGKSSTGVGGSASQRQRLTSLSDDNGKPLSVCAIFAKSRSWLLEPPNVTREAPHRIQRKAVDSLFVMAGHGALIQYDLDTKLAANVAKEKICDDTPIELEVEAKAQWNLGRRKDGSQELMPPLGMDNWLVKDRNSCMLTDSTRQYDDGDERTESWLSQVEIITHAGPHRRLWMGPQFVFKTYNTPSGSNLNHVDAEAVEVGVTKSTTSSTAATTTRLERSSPLNMPLSATGRSAVPVLIESGSYSSIEQSPKLMDRFRHEHLDSDFSVAHGDTRLKEDLADAMRESPSVSNATHREGGGGRLLSDAASSDSVPFYDALAEHDHDHENDDDDDDHDHDNDDDHCFDLHRPSSAAAAALANALPNICSYETSVSYETLESLKKPQKASIEKVVNPLGTVTTVTAGMSAEVQTDILDEVVSQLAAEDCVIHENCDEALFRPVVAIFCDENSRQQQQEQQRKDEAERDAELNKPPEVIKNKLIVPVIAKEVDAELSRKEKQKSGARAKLRKEEKEKERKHELELQLEREREREREQQQKFTAYSNLNKKSKAQPKEVGNGKATEVVTAAKKDEPRKIERKSAEKEIVNEPVMTKETVPDTKKINEKEMGKIEIPMATKKPDKIEEQYTITVVDIDVSDDDDEVEISMEPEELPPQPAKRTSSVVKEPTSDATIAIEKDAKKGESSKMKSKIAANFELEEERTNRKANDEDKKMEKTKKTETKIKTELLNVSNLMDSLKEIKDDDDIEEEKIVEPVKLAEPVEIYVPPKLSKKKQRQSRSASNSNSESEEVVEMTIKLPKKQKNNNKVVVTCEKESKKEEMEKLENKNISKPKLEDYISLSGDKKVIDRQIEKIDDEANKKSSLKGKKQNRNDKTASDGEEDIAKVTVQAKNIEETESKNALPTPKDKESKDEKKSPTKLEKPENNEKVVEKLTKKDEESKNAKNPIESPRKWSEIAGNSKKGDQPLATEESKKEINKTVPIAKESKETVIEIEKPKEQEKTKSDSKTSPVAAKRKDEPKSPKKSAGIAVKCDTEKMPPPSVGGSWVTKDESKSTKTPKSEDEIVITKQPTMTKKDVNPKVEQAPLEKQPGKIEKQSMNSLDKSAASSPSKKDKSKGGNTKGGGMKQTPLDFDDFPMLKSLENLPPLPVLEPLEMMTSPVEAKPQDLSLLKDTLTEQVSLINFESPLQENPALTRKITPPPRGFTEQNLIFALCGSLHYENENSNKSIADKVDVSPTLSLTRSSSVLGGDQSTADYKSLTENDEQYMSLELSSQETNTTNTTTTNEKCFSSSNSSASEDVIILEEKKMTKKQKRKRLQQQQEQLELMKQKTSDQSKKSLEVDEELCPLISMSDSQLETFVEHFGAPAIDMTTNIYMDDDCYRLKKAASSTQLAQSTTTDSEGPLPATTSDDNVFTLPLTAATSSTTPNKLKTKKLEHKINLIGAIEAATSSSTSSAEESSGVEIGGRTIDPDAGGLFTVTAIPTILPNVTANIVGVTQSAAKKKTKRRKR